MCGIAGCISKDSLPLQAMINRSLNSINHRGPDDKRIVCGSDFAIGSVRLSIEAIDVGHQPIENDQFVVGFNGELFNYKSLADKYSLPQVYQISEVHFLLGAWQKHGAQIFTEIDGQFSAFIYDKLLGKLWLFRDPYGIRPLFYFQDRSLFYFCSEAKGIFSGLQRNFDLDASAFAEVAMFWTQVGSSTPFKGIYQVPPGHYLTLENEVICLARYFIDPLISSASSDADLELSPASLLRELIEETVKSQIHGEVGQACYLSGGIDSSAMALMLSRASGGNRLDTFSVEFEDDGYDESAAQKEVAKLINSRHHSVRIRRSDIAQNFGEAIHHCESILFRTAPVPLLLLSKLVSQAGHKVVFTGEGADEILLGYDLFMEHRIRLFWKRQPESISRPALMKRLYSYLPQFRNSRYFSLIEDFYRSSLSEDDPMFFSHLVRWAQFRQISQYFDLPNDLDENVLKARLESFLPDECSHLCPDRKAQVIEINTLLSGYLLSSQGDRMTMANSVESRYPYLGKHFTETVAKFKRKGLALGIKTKSLFRQSLEGQLPENILNRPKFAYQAPEAKAFLSSEHKTDASDFLNDTLKNLRWINPVNFNSLQEKIMHPYSSERLGFRENMAYVMCQSYAHLEHCKAEWSK